MRRILYLLLLAILTAIIIILLSFAAVRAQDENRFCLECSEIDGKKVCWEVDCYATPTPTSTPTATNTPLPTLPPTATPTNTPVDTVEPSPTPENTPLPTLEPTTLPPLKTCTLRMMDANFNVRVGPGTQYASAGYWFKGTERVISRFAYDQNNTYLWAYSDESPAGWSAVYGNEWYVAGTPGALFCTEVEGWPDGLQPPEAFALWTAPNQRGLHLNPGAHCDAVLQNLSNYGTIKGITGTAECIKQIASVSPDTLLIWRNWVRLDGTYGDGPEQWGQGDPVAVARNWWEREYTTWQALGLVGTVDLFEYRNELAFVGDWELAFDAEIMRLAANAGVCLAMFSDGYGNPMIEQFNARWPVLDTMLTTECRPNRRNVIAAHSYGPYDGPLVEWTFHRWLTQRAAWRTLYGDKYDDLQWVITEFGVANTDGDYYGSGTADCARDLYELANVVDPTYAGHDEIIGYQIFAMGLAWLNFGICL